MKTTKLSVGKIIGFLFTLIIAITVITPILWLFVSSFKTDKGVITYPPTFFPTEWTLNQYINVGKSIPILTLTKNTVIFAGGVTILSLMFDSMAGYAFARMNFGSEYSGEALFGRTTFFMPFLTYFIGDFSFITNFLLKSTLDGS